MEPLNTAINYGYSADRIAQQRSLYFRGRAKVKLSNLEFERDEVLGTRPEDKANTQRLVEVFRTEGCVRLEPEHHVAAVVSEDQLHQSLLLSSTSQEALIQAPEPPILNLSHDTKLICLYGKHRLKAAEICGEDWWVVELYLDELPAEARSQLREESSNSKNFLDGVIYRTFRQYQLVGDVYHSRKWWARLSSDEKKKQIRRLQRHERLMRGYDRLLPFIGLWDTFVTGHIKLILGLRCPEETLRYLDRMHQILTELFPGESAALVDSNSVRHVEGLMPVLSSQDRFQIETKMASKVLFPLVLDASDRERLRTKLLQTDRFLSLHTLAQDAAYLSPAVTALKKLLPPKFEQSIRNALLKLFQMPETGCQIQVSEYKFEPLPHPMDAADLSILQLWLFAMRHFVKPHAGKPQERSAYRSWLNWPSEQRRLYLLASFAQRLGFQSTGVLADPSYGDLGRQLLEAVFQEEFLDTKQSNFSTAANRMGEIIGRASSRQEMATDHPVLATDDISKAARRRSNSPTATEYLEERRYFYLGYVYCPDQPSAAYPTSFAVTRQIFFSFFGREPFYGILSSQATAENTAECDHRGENLATPEFQNPRQFHSSPLASIPEQPMESDTSVEPVEFEPHPPGSPPIPSRSMEIEPPIADGFENSSSVVDYHVKSPIVNNLDAWDIINIWNNSSKKVIVLFLFESREYIKFPVRDPIHLPSTMSSLSKDHYFFLMENDDNISISEGFYEDILQHRLLLVMRKDGPSQRENLVFDSQGVTASEQEQILQYVKKYVVATGKRSRPPEDVLNAGRRVLARRRRDSDGSLSDIL
ncbi:hypothetical protein Plec18167_006153 [Paecilomyces lecythidis]|uniref:Uncharacterized protein n=1 Tax=Paecilomyces lecythidis TaxID=3004212 RepID=A0ABR3XCF2_9EURO